MGNRNIKQLLFLFHQQVVVGFFNHLENPSTLRQGIVVIVEVLNFIERNSRNKAKFYHTMKSHTTNYINTFIEVAEDCSAVVGEIPPVKGDTKSIANIQYEIISANPYRFTSDDILFQVFANRNDVTPEEYEPARAALFSKGQPCMRSSPLTKRYGWGIHNDVEGKVALYGRETEEYAKLVNDNSIKKVKAMRSKKV